MIQIKARRSRRLIRSGPCARPGLLHCFAHDPVLVVFEIEVTF